MERKFLESLSIPADQIDRILAEHGKAMTELRDKSAKEAEKLNASTRAAEDNYKKQLEALSLQKAELEKTIKEAPGIDEAIKAATAEMEKTHQAALKELQDSAAQQVAILKRDGDTADFLRSLNRKFATPETETIFRQRLNEALQDTKYEGKNRADIFADLIKGVDGKERTDIFQSDDLLRQQQGAAGAHGTPPAGAQGLPSEMVMSFSAIRGRDTAVTTNKT